MPDDRRTPQNSQNIRVARRRRVSKLAQAVTHWQRLASQGEYPRSLHDILLNALTCEYRLGYRRGRR